MSYFAKPLPAYAIFASFFLFTLPLAAIAVFWPSLPGRNSIEIVYFATAGLSHFFLTLIVYMRSEHLRYFGSSLRNQVIYFIIPAIIFLFFIIYRLSVAGDLASPFDRALVLSLKILNLYHWGRQAFAILQIFREESGEQSAKVWRVWDSGYFLLLSSLTILSFFFEERPEARAYIVMAGAVLIPAYAIMNFRSRAFGASFTYLILQSAAALWIVWKPELYVFALAMHYIEYHVVMYPRCFHTPLAQGRADRVFEKLRANKMVFYFILLSIAILPLLMLPSEGRKPDAISSSVMGIFDGLFLFHFYVEGFIWRFSNKHFRKELIPVLFPTRGSS